MDDPNLLILFPIVEALGELCEKLVFVGGRATGLLLTAQRAQSIRPTLDVDVVAHAGSIAKYHAMERQLEASGFSHDLSADAPICRWIKDRVLFDMMPSEPGPSGFAIAGTRRLCKRHRQSRYRTGAAYGLLPRRCLWRRSSKHFMVVAGRII